MLLASSLPRCWPRSLLLSWGVRFVCAERHKRHCRTRKILSRVKRRREIRRIAHKTQIFKPTLFLAETSAKEVRGGVVWFPSSFLTTCWLANEGEEDDEEQFSSCAPRFGFGFGDCILCLQRTKIMLFFALVETNSRRFCSRC